MVEEGVEVASSDPLLLRFVQIIPKGLGEPS